MNYEAVIFDLDGTLIQETTWAEKIDVVRHIASTLSIPFDDFLNVWHNSFNQYMKGTRKSGQIFIRYICEQLEVDIEDEDRIDIAADILSENSKKHVMKPRQDALKVLQYLKSNNFRTGLVSNCHTAVPEVWDDTPFAPLIDVTIFSCSEGLMKPDPRIYRLALERLSVEPKNCLYIADGIRNELSTASEIGMHAVMLSVPGENENDPYREDWDGPVVSSLTEMIAFLE
jgi:putative hydrolase of the HAD superfamily